MKVEHVIAGLELELAAALADCNGDVCSKFLTEDFAAITGVEGQQLTVRLREEWLKSVTAGSTNRFTIDDTAISVHGGVAIATMLWVEGNMLGSTHWLITDVWKGTDSGEWRLAERHSGRPSPKTT